MSKYYKLIVNITGDEIQENIIGILNYISNFESVLQEETELVFSYQIEKQSKENLIDELQVAGIKENWRIEDELDINWNERYEQSFKPIQILNNEWGVRASFHPKLNVKHEIVIDPKMSFGTGHHETTKQVMEMITKIDVKRKSVWDYGTGTGILAIMSDILGAKGIKANDNEEWAYHNSLENAAINNCQNIEFFLGDIAECESAKFLIPDKDKFDIIIANITKNILLESALMIDQYSKKGTDLILSGFYQSDIHAIEEKFKCHHFTLYEKTILNKWSCLRLIKN